MYSGREEDMEDGVDRAPDAMHTSARASKDSVPLLNWSPLSFNPAPDEYSLSEKDIFVLMLGISK